MGQIHPYQPPADRPRILVVDDSGSVREHLSRLLQKPPLEAEIECAEDGAAGLRRVSEREFDCVVCDLEMPVLDGRKFLAAVRQKRTPEELPVLILTVRGETTEKIDRLRGGASDFLTKPWDDDELVARVEAQVRMVRAARLAKTKGGTDPLTGVGNLGWLLERTSAELNRASRAQHKVAIILADLDGFTALNDEHGKKVGDQVLAHVAEVIRRGFRGYDVVARTGADEFAVLLPDADVRVARFVADRLKERVAADDTGPMKVTISAGCTAGPAHKDDDAHAMLKRAEDALRGR